MIEPVLNHVICPGAASDRHHHTQPGDSAGAVHRMAYWEWNQTGNHAHPHVIICVHGLTRQGRDFDRLAQVLSQHARVICPDVAGRGHSDWLADPMGYCVPQYTADMLALIHQLQAGAAIGMLDWIGTSMGGLIGMCVAGTPQLPLPTPVRRLILNDVGPRLEWAALERIGTYVGQSIQYSTQAEAAAWLRSLSPGFGPHTDAQWLALSQPMLRPLPQGGFGLHYDPAIAQPMRDMTQELSDQGEILLWNLYDHITARTLLIRGADSDLLSRETASEMSQRGPRAQCVELENVGHAPTFVDAAQIAIVQEFLLNAQ